MSECTYISWINLLFIIQAAVFVNGDATFEMRMITYRNPTGSVSAIGPTSCDTRYLGKYWRCDTYFYICLKKAPGDSAYSNCDYFFAKTGKYQDQNNIVFGKDIKSVSNPIKVHLKLWPGSIRFNLCVRDRDTLELIDAYIDWMSAIWKITAARNISQSKWSDTKLIKGTRENDPTSLTVKYRLYCKENYYNTSCDVRCVASNGPKRHTLCDPATGAELCLPGWEGPDCDIVSDDCIGNNCTKEASCKDGHRQYTCICVPGFTGRYCEKNINECASSPCLNGSTCVDKIDSFVCVCKRGYYGTTCSHNKCDSGNSPCMNYGTCFIDTRDNVRCNCPKAFTGEVCEREKCLDIVCQNVGICKDGICVCRQGYVGQFCDVKLCDNIECMHGGMCKDGKCFCTRGYTGVYCTRRIDVRGPAYSVVQKGDDEGGDRPQPGQPAAHGGPSSNGDKTTKPHEGDAKTKASTNLGPKASSSLPLTIGVVLVVLTYTIR